MKFTETSATGVSDVTGVSGDSAAGPPLVGAGGKSSWSSGANGYAVTVTYHSAALASESLPLAPTCVLVCGDSAIPP